MERPSLTKCSPEIRLYIESLESELKQFKESPYCTTYITILNQIESFNEQLTIKKVQTLEGEIVLGKIDLFADKEAKEFDRGWKYMLEATEMLTHLDELRKLMTPEQQAEAQKEVMLKNIGLAEKIAMKQNGTKQN